MTPFLMTNKYGWELIDHVPGRQPVSCKFCCAILHWYLNPAQPQTERARMFQAVCCDRVYYEREILPKGHVIEDCPGCEMCEGLPYVCEYCGERVAELITVDDSDRAVGYVDHLEVCETCAAKHLRRRR